MRAIGINPRKREVGLIEHDPPEIQSGKEVKVRSLEVGVCGTDREICNFVYGEPPEGSDYLILGHESLGEVVEVGREVVDFKPGDLVAPSVRRPCPDAHCQPCRSGLQDFCANGSFTERGIKMEHGFMAEFYVEHDQYLNYVPAELRDVAVLIEPLTIAEKAISQIWRIQSRLPWTIHHATDQEPGKGLTALVLGAGPVGILGAMALKTRGFNTLVYSRSKAPNPKAELLESIGVPYYSALEIDAQELKKKAGGEVDLIYEGVGVPEITFDVLPVLGHNGVFVFTGIPGPQDAVPIPADQIMRDVVLKNQLIIGTVNADEAAFLEAVRDLGRFHRQWPKAVRSIITRRFAPEEHRDLLLGKTGGIKNVISFA